VKSALRPGALLFAGLLVLSACQSSASSSPSQSQAAGSEQPSADNLSGDIQISGSSTVQPITSRVFEAFTALHPNVTGFVDGPGTGDGFALFCNGETDISDASRTIKDEEATTCADAGIEYVGLKVGIDGLSVITSVDNTAIECLSLLDLYALLGPESQSFSSWSDANDLAAELATQLGGDYGESHAPYPDQTLTISGPGEESGTFDSFIELALSKIAAARNQDATTRPDYQAFADDNVIIEGVAGTADAPYTLGWVGFGVASENLDKVHLVAVDKGDERWTGYVGVIPRYVREVAPKAQDAVAITCGPPVMIKFTLPELQQLGFTDEQIITTLEMKMKCGVGKCGRCNIGHTYVCLDGPVFTYAQIRKLPAEF